MLYQTTTLQKAGILALLVLFGLTSIAQAEPPVPVAPQPTWALDVPPNLDAEVPLETVSSGVHYLLVDSQVRVGDDNQPEYFYHYAERVLNQTGVEGSSQITIDFDPTYESLTLHEIIIWRDGRSIDKVDTARMSLIHREEELNNLLYNGHQTLHVILDDVRTGDTIEYSFTRQGDNPIYNGIFAYSQSLNWSVPIHRQALAVHWHKQTPLYHQFLNSELSLQTEHIEGGVRYRLDNVNVEPLIEDENLPGWFDPYGMVYFSESENWRQVADWARPLMESGIENNNEIRKIAKRILDRHSDPTEQIAAALQYVQEEIRYFGIEIGENSHRPAKASVTLTRRYGDCKDKSMLLLSILRELGIEGHAALVNTRRKQGINDIIPGARQFNHVIASVAHEGKIYWLDPTRQYQYGGLHAIYQPDFGYALVLRPNAAALTAMTPVQAPSGSEVRDFFDLSVGKDAPVPYTVQTTTIGLDAEHTRQRQASNGHKATQDDYLNFYKDYYAHIKSAGPITFDDNPERNEMIVEERYMIDNLWELDEDDNNYHAWFYSNTISHHLKAPTEKQRSHPLALAHPVNLQQIIELKLDEQNWHFDDEEFNEDNDFFSFTNTVRFNKAGKKLTLEYTYQSKTDAVPPERLRDYLAALERTDSNINYSIFSSFAPTAANAAEEEANYFAWIIGLFILTFIAVIVLWRIDASRYPYNGEMIYYPVTLLKFIALWSLTFSIYGVYWFYRNWKYVRQRDQSDIMPLARGIFYSFWYYPLFKELREDSIRRHGQPRLPAPVVGAVLAFAFLILNVAGSFVGYEIFFTCAASLLLLPVVNSINQINGHDDPAYQHNSRWRVHHYLLTLLALPLLAITLGGETGLMPGDRVIPGKKLFSHDIKFLQRKGAIAPNENIVYFYSDAFLSIRNDGNGYTDRHMFSYWLNNGDFELHTAEYTDIKDIQVTWGDLIDSTVVKVIRHDESWFILYASTTKKKDKAFVNGLMTRWKKAVPKVEASPVTAEGEV